MSGWTELCGHDVTGEMLVVQICRASGYTWQIFLVACGVFPRTVLCLWLYNHCMSSAAVHGLSTWTRFCMSAAEHREHVLALFLLSELAMCDGMSSYALSKNLKVSLGRGRIAVDRC